MLTHLEIATSPIHCLGGSGVLLTLLFVQIVYSWSSFLYSLAINYQHVLCHMSIIWSTDFIFVYLFEGT